MPCHQNGQNKGKLKIGLGYLKPKEEPQKVFLGSTRVRILLTDLHIPKGWTQTQYYTKQTQKPIITCFTDWA